MNIVRYFSLLLLVSLIACPTAYAHKKARKKYVKKLEMRIALLETIAKANSKETQEVKCDLETLRKAFLCHVQQEQLEEESAGSHEENNTITTLKEQHGRTADQTSQEESSH